MNIFEHTQEIALLIVLIGILGMTYMGIEVTEPMNNISLMVVSAVFGASVPKSK